MRNAQHFYLFFAGTRGQHIAGDGTWRTEAESMHVDETDGGV